MTQAELLTLIEQAATEGWTKLDLAGENLTELPAAISRVTQLEVLILGKYDKNKGWLGNQLSELPTEIGQLTNLQQLDLFDNQLTGLPTEIGQLTSLQQLDLRYNQLSELPTEIGQLTSLQQLDLSHNQLNALPVEIGQLTSLRQLDLSHNQLSELPTEIGQLTSLQQLSLSYGKLSELPAEIGQLTSLQQLSLSYGKLSELPAEIGQLTSLQQLFLSDNQLNELPAEIGQLTSLQQLSLSHNQLNELPTEIGQLTGLQLLDLRYNQLNELPAEIGQLTSLRQSCPLYLSGNMSLIDPPPEIVHEGTQEILDYFRQVLEQGRDYLFEAKFLIVGAGGVGKTSLAYKLVDPNYELDAQQPSTEGIDVVPWEFELPDGTSFRANIWDFGGQEIYHATHQFFLTKRSLYALVVDTRKEDTDLYYWLSVVSLFSNDSPVLIIKNEKGDRPCEVNDRQLRGEFLNLKETLATNLKTNRGLESIQQTIHQYISKLPHVGTPLPKKWVEVRRVLETDPRNYILTTEYFTICETHGFTQRNNQLQLSDYLHDLGVCLHFQQDPILKHIIILKPEWGTDAVYNVLDTRAVYENYGRFTRDQLNDIWSDDAYVDMRDELLQLMRRFKLCYEIPGRPHHYIAPQLLDRNSPDYDWNPSANLIFRYRYDFMPKGILTRLIVELHEYIENQCLVWKNGAVFANGSARAEVIEHYPKREILIRVSGTDQREWLAVITHELEKIHQSFERLQYKALVPCNCNECNGSQTPYDYPYEKLKKAIRANPNRQISCMNSFQMVNVQGLLDAILYQSIAVSVDNHSGSNHTPHPQGLPLQDVSQIRANAPVQYFGSLNRKERLELFRTINGLPQAQFEALVFALKLPAGVMPPVQDASGNRVKALLDWAEGSTGPGIQTVRELLDEILASS